MGEPSENDLCVEDEYDLLADLAVLRKENARLRALAADLRNRLYFRGENVDEADAILLPNGWPSPDLPKETEG